MIQFKIKREISPSENFDSLEQIKILEKQKNYAPERVRELKDKHPELLEFEERKIKLSAKTKKYITKAEKRLLTIQKFEDNINKISFICESFGLLFSGIGFIFLGICITTFYSEEDFNLKILFSLIISIFLLIFGCVIYYINNINKNNHKLFNSLIKDNDSKS